MIDEITASNEINHRHFLHCDSCIHFVQIYIYSFRVSKSRKLRSIEIFHDVSLLLVRPIWRESSLNRDLKTTGSYAYHYIG